MIVCHCRGITDRDLRSLVRSGRAAAAREIGRAKTGCSAGHGCGGCSAAIIEIVQIAELEESSRSKAILAELAPAL